MKRRLKFFFLGVLFLSALACGLPMRAPTPIPTRPVELTLTAMTALLSTPSPLVWTATPAPSVTDTPAPIPTAPELIRLVTGASAVYLEVPPTLDGVFDEWAVSAFSVSSPVYGIQNWTGLDDLSGLVMLGWDEDYFYIAVQVTDNVYVQNSAGSYLYQGDSLEILFDTYLDVDFYDNTLNADDYQLGISPGNPAAGSNMEAYLWLPTDFEERCEDVTIASHTTDVGYNVEAAIPWAVFDITPQPWQHYGFAVSLSDNDDAEITAQQSMVSNSPDRRLTRPMTWGDLVLTR